MKLHLILKRSQSFLGSTRLTQLVPMMSLHHFLLCPLPTPLHRGLLTVPGNIRHSHTSRLWSGYSPCLEYLIHTSAQFIPPLPSCLCSTRAMMTTHLKSHPSLRIPNPSDPALFSPSPSLHSTYCLLMYCLIYIFIAVAYFFSSQLELFIMYSQH